MDLPGRKTRRRYVGLVGLLAVGAATGLGMRAWERNSEPSQATIEEAVQLKRWDEAEKLLARWVARYPGDGRAWLKLGSVLGIQGRAREAGEAFARVAADDPARGKAQVLLGELANRAFDAAGAERAFRAAAGSGVGTEADPDSVRARTRLLALLIVERRTEEARTILWELFRLTRDPRHLVTLTGMALEEGPQRIADLGGERERYRRDIDLYLK